MRFGLICVLASFSGIETSLEQTETADLNAGCRAIFHRSCESEIETTSVQAAPAPLLGIGFAEAGLALGTMYFIWRRRRHRAR
jgi:hypothetical protein